MTDSAPRASRVIEFGNGMKIELLASDPTLRVDLWIDEFDGKYRLALPIPQVQELQHKCGYADNDGIHHPRGIFAIYGAVARGRYELEGRSVGFAVEGVATLAECRETIRLALIGGGAALVDGERVKVDAARAKQLVENYLVPAPVERSWDIAYLILHTIIHGRRQRPNEAGISSIVAVYPSDEEDEEDRDDAHVDVETPVVDSTNAALEHAP